VLAPLRRRDFRLLWTGTAVSLLGDGVFMVAIAWQAYSVSRSPAGLAYVGLATSLPQVLLFLLGGAVSDRLPRRTILVLADLARAATLAALSAAVAGGSARLWDLCLTGAVVGTATAFASPAFDAMVPQIVPRDELLTANAIDQFVRPGALQLAGPALGGLAVATIGAAGCFAFDASSFAFSALCVGRVVGGRDAAARAEAGQAVGGPAVAGQVAPASARPRSAALLGTGGEPATSNLRQDLAEGWRYVLGYPWLWATFAAATLTYLLFIGPTQVLLPYIVRYVLHDNASTYGLVLGIGGCGALGGAMLASRWRRAHSGITLAYICWAVATLAVAGYGLARGSLGLAAAALVVNGAEAAGAVVWSTLKQTRVPNWMLGRVSSIDWCISTALLPLSYAFTAPVAHLLGARATLVTAGVLGAVVTMAFLYVPGVRGGYRAGGPGWARTGQERLRAGEGRLS